MAAIHTATEPEGRSAAAVFRFFLLTYVVSWTFFAAYLATGVTPLILVGVWGPTLMGMALTARYHGAAGLRRFLGRFGRIRIGLRWWIALLLLPAGIHFAGRSAWQLLGPGTFDPELWFSVQTVIMSFVVAGFGEELGWRGFALPRLQQRYSPLVASLILAVVHLLWHLPAYWLREGIHTVPFVFIAAFVVPWTVIFTWIYNRSGGSLVFAVGFHAISNISLSLVRFMPLDSEVPITPELLTRWSLPAGLAGPYLSVVAVYWIVAAIVVLSGGLRPANTDTP